MSNFTMADLKEVEQAMNDIEKPMVDAITKIFTDNDVDVDSHILFLPNEFKSMIIVPRRLRETVLFSPHLNELIFIKKDKPPRFEYKSYITLKHPCSVINYNGA